MVTILWFLVKLWLTISENECWSFRDVCVYAKSLHLFPGYLKEGRDFPLIGNSQREPGHDISTSVLGCFARWKIPHATLDCPAGPPECKSLSVVSDSLWPHGLCSPWNFPGQNTGVGKTTETVTDFILGGSKITAGGDCSHEAEALFVAICFSRNRKLKQFSTF